MKKTILTVCVLFVVFFSSCKKHYTCACTQLDSSEPITFYQDLESYHKETSRNYCENLSDIYTNCELK